MPTPNPLTPPSFVDLLRSAIEQPGILHECYSRFHTYSLGNQLLAWAQCLERGLPLGPIATYQRWRELARHVRKGEKALTLCMPVTIKRTESDRDTGDECESTFTRFVYKPRWFVLAQTDGAEYVAPEPPSWSKADALLALDIAEIPFAALDGNCQGYAQGRSVAVSPVAAMPFKTLIHECAHVVLGHTAEADMHDSEITPRDIRELEAEAVAYLVLGALGQPGLEYSRGYIQHWYSGQQIPEKSAQRILKVADAILRAGHGGQTEGR
jgi:antirestriction protein ArdC